MIKKKRLLFIVTAISNGGAEQSLKTITDRIDYSKFEVDLFPVIDSKRYPITFHPNVRLIEGFPSWEALDAGKTNGVNHSFLTQQLQPIYDVQIGFMEGISVFFAQHYGNPNAKKIAWVHSDLSVTGHIINSFKEEYNKMDTIVLVSNGLKKDFIKRFGDAYESKCLTIYNMFNKEQIKLKSNEPLSYSKDGLTLISVGRLSPEKQFDLLINVHKKLLNDGLHHNFLILGEGPERLKLESLISTYEVNQTFKLIGYTSNPYNWIKMCDIFVSSSTAEACPLVIGESMILNKPIVATINIGSTDLLEYKYGLLVENNLDGLYQGLRYMIESNDIRHYYSMLLQNVSLFNQDQINNQIETLFIQ